MALKQSLKTRRPPSFGPTIARTVASVAQARTAGVIFRSSLEAVVYKVGTGPYGTDGEVIPNTGKPVLISHSRLFWVFKKINGHSFDCFLNIVSWIFFWGGNTNLTNVKVCCVLEIDPKIRLIVLILLIQRKK